MALTKFRVTHIKPAESALLLLPANSVQCQAMKGRIASPGGEGCKKIHKCQFTLLLIERKKHVQSSHPEEELPTTSRRRSYIRREGATLARLPRCAEPEWETLDTENCSDMKIYCHTPFFRARGMINNPCVSYQGKHFQNIFCDWSASSTSPPYWDTLGAKLLMFAKGTQRKALEMQTQLEICFSIINIVCLMTQTQF